MKEYGNEIELIEFIVKSLVDKQDEVKLNVIEGEKSTILELRVSQSDVGKIIGRRGRIARAIRTLLGACAAKTNRRVQLEILDWFMFIKGVILSSYGVNGYARVKSISNNFCDFINLKDNKVLLKKAMALPLKLKL